jgi:hypothetical protein
MNDVVDCSAQASGYFNNKNNAIKISYEIALI